MLPVAASLSRCRGVSTTGRSWPRLRAPSRSRSRGSSSGPRTSRRRPARCTAACSRCRCSGRCVPREPALRPAPAAPAHARLAGRRPLRARPDRLALRDRAGRRRAGNRARQPAGRVRRPARVGDPGRAAVEPVAGGDPCGLVRRAADLRGPRERRLREEPRARRRLRHPDRVRSTRASCSSSGPGTRTSGGRPGRCSTPRSSRGSPASRSVSRSATSTGLRAGPRGVTCCCWPGARRRSAGC